MNRCTERLYNGIVKENPTFVMMLGMCPTLAVTSSLMNGFGMGLTTTVVLAASNLMISMLRKHKVSISKVQMINLSDIRIAKEDEGIQEGQLEGIRFVTHP